jgi:hypothetical protein
MHTESSGKTAMNQNYTGRPWKAGADCRKKNTNQKGKEKHMNVKNENIGSLEKNLASELNEDHPSVRVVVTVALALWFGLVFLLGIQGAFVGPPGSPPLPIFFGFAIPLAVFFAAYFGWSAFREFVLGADLRLVAAIQAWRWGGLGFLSLYAHGILPGLFAFPAGLGDMAIGIAAPGIVLGLIRRPSFATSRQFVMWNILGITDLVVAVSMGTICSGFLRGLTGSVTTGPMAQLPLVLIPAYMVPLFIMLHFTALFQARKFARSAKSALPKNI